MRVATFNVSSGRSPIDGLVDVERFAAAIAALDADLLALQEVDRDQPRSHGADLTEIAAAAMGAPYRYFVPALYGTPGESWTRADRRAQQGPAYGCALLSRLPLSLVDVIRIPAAPVALPLWVPAAGVIVVREEPRVAIVARVETAGRGTLTVVNTHLPFVPGWNRWQLRRLAAAIRKRPDPLLLMGDLNLRGTVPERLTGYRSLVRAPSFPAGRPRVQLDHILLRGKLGDVGSVAPIVIPQAAVSDHRPVAVDIEPHS